MGFFDGIGQFFSNVGKAIGSVVQTVAQAVSSIAGVIKDVAGAVSDFIKNNPLGQLLQAIPGVGGLIGTIGSVAGTIASVAGTVQNFANQAVDFAKVLGGSVGNSVSATALGSMAAVTSHLHHTRDLARVAEQLGRPHQERLSTADRAMARLGTINYAQILAQRHAQLIA